MNTEETDIYLRGLHDGMRAVIEAIESRHPFPFRADHADRDGLLGPFCVNGFESDAEQERIEHIINYYLLSLHAAARVTLTHTFFHLYDLNTGKRRDGTDDGPLTLPSEAERRLDELADETLRRSLAAKRRAALAVVPDPAPVDGGGP